MYGIIGVCKRGRGGRWGGESSPFVTNAISFNLILLITVKKFLKFFHNIAEMLLFPAST